MPFAAVKTNCITGYTRKSLATKQRVVVFPTRSVKKPASGTLCLLSPPALPSTGEMLTNGEDLANTCEGG